MALAMEVEWHHGTSRSKCDRLGWRQGRRKACCRACEEHVGSTGGERADFITFVDQCIAEMVETQSLSEVVSAAGGGSKATVQNQEDAACQMKSQPSDD